MKFSPGDRVHVQSERGRGSARVTGFDEESGMYKVRFEDVTVKENGRTIAGSEAQGHVMPGHVSAEAMVKRRGK